MISQIRLAWWRESLEKLDDQPAPAEPVLRAVAEHILPLAVSGRSLAEMEAGWAALAAPHALEAEELRNYARDRGGRLFSLSARLLGEDWPFLEDAGQAWALIDLARHSGEPDSAAALALAQSVPAVPAWPYRLRPLGMLWVLAKRDLTRTGGPFEQQGSPARMWRMFRHRLTGR
jgi:phytoene synthase